MNGTMSRWPSRKSARHPVGLDLEGDYVAAAEAVDGRLVRVASDALPRGAMQEGEVADPVLLADALREFARRNALPSQVRLGIGNRDVAVRTVELPRIADERELAAAVRFQAAEAIPMPLDEAVLDHQVVGEIESADGPPRVRVVVVAAREQMVSGIADAVRRAGLRPEAIDLNAFALVRMLAEAPVGDGPPSGARAYLHLGDPTNLAIALGRTCVFTRSLTAPRREDGEPDPIGLADEVRPSIYFYNSQPEAQPVEAVILSGPGAATEGLANALADAVGHPVSVAVPLAGLFSAAVPEGEDPHRHTVAAGLALGATA